MRAILFGLFGLLALASSMATVAAQPYVLTGHSITAGGVFSGGRFQVAVSFGQPEAWPQLTGRCLSIDPGFWVPSVAVPLLDAPVLYVQQVDPNYVRVAFRPSCGEWVLQWTRTLEAQRTVWTDDAASNLVPIGDQLTRDFHVPSWGPGLYFRLARP